MIKRTVEHTDIQDTVYMMAFEISRNDWSKLIDSLLEPPAINLSPLSDVASSLSVTFAEISEYLNMRGASGCGDSGHDEAMKSVMRTRKAVRKALGYSYP